MTGSRSGPKATVAQSRRPTLPTRLDGQNLGRHLGVSVGNVPQHHRGLWPVLVDLRPAARREGASKPRAVEGLSPVTGRAR